MSDGYLQKKRPSIFLLHIPIDVVPKLNQGMRDASMSTFPFPARWIFGKYSILRCFV